MSYPTKLMSLCDAMQFIRKSENCEKYGCCRVGWENVYYFNTVGELIRTKHDSRGRVCLPPTSYSRVGDMYTVFGIQDVLTTDWRIFPLSKGMPFSEVLTMLREGDPRTFARQSWDETAIIGITVVDKVSGTIVIDVMDRSEPPYIPERTVYKPSPEDIIATDWIVNGLIDGQ